MDVIYRGCNSFRSKNLIQPTVVASLRRAWNFPPDDSTMTRVFSRYKTKHETSQDARARVPFSNVTLPRVCSTCISSTGCVRFIIVDGSRAFHIVSLGALLNAMMPAPIHSQCLVRWLSNKQRDSSLVKLKQIGVDLRMKGLNNIRSKEYRNPIPVSILNKLFPTEANFLRVPRDKQKFILRHSW